MQVARAGCAGGGALVRGGGGSPWEVVADAHDVIGAVVGVVDMRFALQCFIELNGCVLEVLVELTWALLEEFVK